MDAPTIFYPERQKGFLLHLLVTLALLGGGGGCIFLSVRVTVGSWFVLLLLLGLAFLAPVPFLGYRGYALLQASYILERDGMRLRWGLRGEDIPLPEIEWIRPASDLAFDLPLPPLAWPGAILGIRNVEGLGPVEFLASSRQKLLLVATPQRVFAISPADTHGFLRSFQYASEMGSLSPMTSFSARPAVFIQQVWDDRLARWLGVAGLVSEVALFTLVGLYIPLHSSVSLGFDGRGRPLPPGPAEHLLLLPVLGAMVFVVDLLAGLFFYRHSDERLVSYSLWVTSVITSLLLIAVTFWIS